MKTIEVLTLALFCFSMTTTGFSQSQAEVRAKMNKDIIKKEKTMKTYVIEREIPEAGQLTKEELKGISQKSNEVLLNMGPGIEWLHSYVTDNKVYCVYRAENEELITEHATKGGFPVDKISELSTKIDPATGKN
jgi:hypothetical protein